MQPCILVNKHFHWFTDGDCVACVDAVIAGAQFALHCVGCLLLPTLQSWLRRPITAAAAAGVNNPAACWDTTMVANFKHYTGLCVDLVVELVVQFTGRGPL